MTSQTALRRGQRRPGPFDRGAWRPGRARAIAAALVASYAVASGGAGGIGWIVTAVLGVDLAVQLLPWRLPRPERGAASLWAEAMLYLALPLAFALVMLLAKEPWLSGSRLTLPWAAAAVAAGAFLLWAGGLPLASLFSGAVAAVAPPVRPAHKGSRVTSVALAPPGEEFLFRGPVLAVPHAAALPLGLVAGAAFVARHHVPPGFSARTTGRALATQIAAAAIFLALTLGSRSLIPALIAHWINNAPSVAFEAMRPVWKEQT